MVKSEASSSQHAFGTFLLPRSIDLSGGQRRSISLRRNTLQSVDPKSKDRVINFIDVQSNAEGTFIQYRALAGERAVATSFVPGDTSVAVLASGKLEPFIDVVNKDIQRSPAEWQIREFSAPTTDFEPGGVLAGVATDIFNTEEGNPFHLRYQGEKTVADAIRDGWLRRESVSTQ